MRAPRGITRQPPHSAKNPPWMDAPFFSADRKRLQEPLQSPHCWEAPRDPSPLSCSPWSPWALPSCSEGLGFMECGVLGGAGELSGLCSVGKASDPALSGSQAGRWPGPI